MGTKEFSSLVFLNLARVNDASKDQWISCVLVLVGLEYMISNTMIKIKSGIPSVFIAADCVLIEKGKAALCKCD